MLEEITESAPSKKRKCAEASSSKNKKGEKEELFFVLQIKQVPVLSPPANIVSRASRSTSGLGEKERLVIFARYSWHVGMQLICDVIAYTFAPTCFDEMFA